MKHFLVLASLLITYPSFSQDSNPVTKRDDHKGLSIGINISPDYCYRTLRNIYGGDVGAAIIKWRDGNEKAVFGYSAGAFINNGFTKHFSIEAGLQYSNKGYQYENSNLTFGDPIDPRYGFIYPTNSAPMPAALTIIYRYYYLDVPVRALFHFGEKKIAFITSIGITTNILLSARQTTVLKYESVNNENTTTDQEGEFNKVNLSPTISAGIGYKISENINLTIEPTFRYGILKIIDAPITGYLWNGGVNFTLNYSLK